MTINITEKPIISKLKIIDFAADVTKGKEPLKVNFTSNVSGSPTIWRWRFGRTALHSFNVSTATYTFRKEGIYDVTLTVKDAAGNKDTLTKKAYIKVKKSKPKAHFKCDHDKGKGHFTVHFTDYSENNPQQWMWDFGDGSKSTLKDPSHTYTKPGKYTVYLTAINSAGQDTIALPNYITVA